MNNFAFGTLRSGDPSASTADHTFTGQKQDGTGLTANRRNARIVGSVSRSIRVLLPFAVSSSSVETNSSGASTAARTYYAYGSTRGSFGTLQTDRTYTGQKQDGTGLLYYNARYYDSALGTFLSPDTLVPDAGQVVDYNRFLYVRGNPLKYVDPSGHIGICFQGSPAGTVSDEGPLGDLCTALGDAGLFGPGDDESGDFYGFYANDSDDKWAAWQWIQSVRSRQPNEPVHLVGYSWGGSAALEFAEFLDTQGVAVESMVLLDPVMRFSPNGRSRTGDVDLSLWNDVLRYTTPSVSGNVKRAINLYASDTEPFSILEGRSTIFGATNVAINAHHASILDANQPQWSLSSSFGYSSNALSGVGEKVNPLTSDVIHTWMRTGEVISSPGVEVMK